VLIVDNDKKLMQCLARVMDALRQVKSKNIIANCLGKRDSKI